MNRSSEARFRKMMLVPYNEATDPTPKLAVNVTVPKHVIAPKRKSVPQVGGAAVKSTASTKRSAQVLRIY
jgi:hypothetical protein